MPREAKVFNYVAGPGARYKHQLSVIAYSRQQARLYVDRQNFAFKMLFHSEGVPTRPENWVLGDARQYEPVR